MLDFERVRDWARAAANLRRLAEQTSGTIGLRIATSQLAAHSTVLDVLAGREHWLIVAGAAPEDAAALAAGGRRLWIEITEGAAIRSFGAALDVAGFAARGSECGGRPGRESAFILAQHLARQERPFLVQGAIGPHNAAACLAAGAFGVIVDDSQLLLRESPLPPHRRALLGRIGLHDTAVVDGVRVVDRPDFPAGDDAWALGESAGRAPEVARVYGTAGRYFRAIVEAADRSLALAAERQPLAPDAPLARSHGTRYPIVQGPMTRVSDRVDFAAAVAANGGLPLIALALMRGPEVEKLLVESRQALAGQSWGIGILGFVPQELRQEQLAVVMRLRPPFALIAGGRPDQAAELEASGIATYLHVPAQLLPHFIEQGARRFIFEGGECGGHVGPLHSFALWESVIGILLRDVPAAESENVHVVFAGGIHDARSAAMVAAMAAPLVERGMKIGVLMGTAYLFCDEAVASGAITPPFQQQALRCEQTVTIETKPGHSIRCAPTPFIGAFEQKKSEMLRRGESRSEAGDALEALIAGRLRIASKGLERVGDELRRVDEQRQGAEGMYMMGEVAALRSARTTFAELHDDVSAGGARILAAAAPARPRIESAPAPKPSAVAIVGIGCLVPGAHDVDALWRNLLDRKSAIREIPRERWDWRLYYDEDAGARDKINSKWGGFIDPLPFDPLHFGIPPNSLSQITLPQLLVLEITRRALRDAGYGDFIADQRLRERTGVTLGVYNTGDLEQLYIARSALPLIGGKASEEMLRRLPEWSEESFPGLLANVVAGRVANRFDLGGPNVTLDAACASSLAALDLAVRELDEGRSDMVLAGGLEFEQSPHAFMGFSKTKALSPRGKARVFDADADGIVISEAGVVMVLKRLADAECDGDRIYAVIRAVAGSSDGKGLGLTAPRPTGQRRALDRAYERAGIDPASIAMYEAHGTGTPVGDAAEAETIDGMLRAYGAAPGACVIGSAKSLLGHTRVAAGMVGLAKTALALHHRVLPPHAGVETPIEGLRQKDSPLALLDEPRPWLDHSDPLPRRAGVSAFGFGGTNYHVIVEEHRGDAAGGAPSGANVWPAELFAASGNDRPSLLAALDRLDKAAAHDEVRFADLAHASVSAAPWAAERVAMVARDRDELRRLIAAAREGRELPSLYRGEGAAQGDVAFLFPGQGSQEVGMGAELALYFDEVRQAFADRDLARIILPPAVFTDDDRADQERALADTRVAQPAIGAVSCGMLDLARRLGITPARVAGHSYGELVALHAAGAIGRDDLMRLSAKRGELMAAADVGAMAVIARPLHEVEALLPDGVVIANVNAPDQIVVSGPAEAVERMPEGRRLNVSAAFHSPLMRSAREPFAAFVNTLTFDPPAIPVHANRDGRQYPEDIGARLVQHLEQRVDFVAQIEAMLAAGVRTFLEVGPGRVLTGLVRRIAGDRAAAIATDGGVAGWLEAMAQLFARGVAVDLLRLFDGRAIRGVDLDHLPQPSAKPGWMIDGGRIWRAGAAQRTVGELPFLDADSPAAVPAFAVPAAAEASTVIEAYRQYEETMRQFLAQQERVLTQIVASAQGAPLAAPPAPAFMPPAAPRLPAAKRDEIPVKSDEVVAALDRQRLTAALLGIVSDRTGYPADMLDLNFDLEAELGVDSIKRVEILTLLQKSLPAEGGAWFRTQLDRFTRVKSLGKLIDAVMAGMPAAGTNVEVASPATAPGGCPRFVMTAADAPLPPRQRRVEGLHIVTEDPLGVAPRVVAMLRERGANAYLLKREEWESGEALERRVGVLRHVHGTVHGVIHLAPLGLDWNDEPALWHEATDVAARSFFRLLQLCASDFEEASGQPRVLAATRLGGAWGRDSMSGSPAAGAVHGLVRTLESEYPRVRGNVIDFDDALPPEEIAARIVDELVAEEIAAEVGYRRGGDSKPAPMASAAESRRYVYLPELASLESADASDAWRPTAGWVVLATGGARGITAEICRDLAAPGVRFVIVGRSPQPDERFAALRAAGAEVEYQAVDVSDGAAFGALIDDLYERYGGIDAVLHGAGIIEDAWLASKGEESFARVFETKAESAFVLMQRLRPETLRWIAIFASVSGRFGNQGQSDYAAANEVANRIAWRMDSRWPSTRVVAINWGPWLGTGMAANATMELLAARGIGPIAPREGRRFFADELSRGRKGVVEVIAGDGPWRRGAASSSMGAATPVESRRHVRVPEVP